METQKIRLTQTVQKGGCAAKVAASELRSILKNVQFPPPHKELLVDGGLFDDAAIYKVTSDIALVQTLDFFTPIVDSPRTFGQVAAANALSDVYAMGGTPKTAMAILAFPLISMDNSVISEILQGASDKIKEANANFVGGHSIDDDTLKFGLSVTGYVHPDKIWSNNKAQVGDVLILTKSIGTGTNMASLKNNFHTEADLNEVLISMAQLNNAIDYLNKEELNSIHAATDVTGFGLAGHLKQMVEASQVNAEIFINKIPLFSKTQICLENNFLTKAHRTNKEYTASVVEFENEVNDLEKLVCFDPQTSGGLLLSVNKEKSFEIVEKLKSFFPSTSVVGEIRDSKCFAGKETRILFRK